jgi:tellurium resistance protein TerD
MEFAIIEKSQGFELDVVSKQEGPKSFYFGAGWDNPNGPVDLDIVCALLVGGALVDQSNFVYFSNKTAPGVVLSEDNQTGEGEGDDESIVINTALIPSEVDKIVIGLVAYAGVDFASAPNPHFRVCDGDEEESTQIADIVVGDGKVDDTVLSAFSLTRGPNGWTLENVAEFHAKGVGTEAIKGFGGLFS